MSLSILTKYDPDEYQHLVMFFFVYVCMCMILDGIMFVFLYSAGRRSSPPPSPPSPMNGIIGCKGSPGYMRFIPSWYLVQYKWYVKYNHPSSSSSIKESENDIFRVFKGGGRSVRMSRHCSQSRGSLGLPVVIAIHVQHCC